MKPITMADIRGPALYEGFRDDLRKTIIDLKKHRRVCVGPMVELVFENRKTLIYQIEEMLRAEHISEPAKIQEEIDVYNPLLPTDDSLSATMFLAVPRDADARTELDRLIGLDEHLLVHIGDHTVRAAFEEGRGTAERISGLLGGNASGAFVHTFCGLYQNEPVGAPPEVWRPNWNVVGALLTPGTPMSIEIDHPQYQHQTSLPEETRASLAADFEGE